MAFRLAGRPFTSSVYPPVREGVLVRDEFTGTLLSAFSTGGGGALSVVGQGDADAPGVARLAVAAVAENARILSERDTSFGVPAGWFPFLLGANGSALYLEARCRVNVVSDGVNQTALRAGFGDVIAADQTNGLYFENDRAVHGDNNWRACTANGGVRTKTNTNVAAATGWQRLRIEISAAGTTARFFIDGALVATISTTMPVGRFGYVLHAVKSLGGAARWFDFDYLEVGIPALTVTR